MCTADDVLPVLEECLDLYDVIGQTDVVAEWGLRTGPGRIGGVECMLHTGGAGDPTPVAAGQGKSWPGSPGDQILTASGSEVSCGGQWSSVKARVDDA